MNLASPPMMPMASPRVNRSNYGPQPNSNYSMPMTYAPQQGAGYTPPSPRMSGGAVPGGYAPQATSFAGAAPASPPMMPSVKASLQSAPMQSPGAMQDRMNMGLIKQNVELPTPEPTTRLASQAGTSSGVSEQNLHQMYTTIQQQHPTLTPKDHAAMFNDTAARYGYNGAALLDKWGGQGIANTSQFPTGETTQTPAVPGMPVSMLGSANSAGNSIAARVPGMSSSQAGMSVGGLPPGMPMAKMGPMQGMTTPPMSTVLGQTPVPGMAPTTSSSSVNRAFANDNQGMANLYATRDNATTPVPQADQARIARNDQTRVRALGDSEIANTPPTPREQFNTGTQLATAAIQQPIDVAEAKAAGRGGSGRKQLLSGAAMKSMTLLGIQGSGEKGAYTADDVADFAKKLGYDVGEQSAGGQQSGGPPGINGDGTPDPYAKGPQGGATGAGQLKPIPRALAQQYVGRAGGDPAKAAALIKQDGFDPSRYAD